MSAATPAPSAGPTAAAGPTTPADPGARIEARISAAMSELSRQERRAAETLLEHLGDLATYRASELARLAGVSKATMSRLFRSLGFADFEEVREHLRDLRSAGEPRHVEAPSSLAVRADAEADLVRSALGALDDAAVADVQDRLAAARRVLVLGWRNSYPVALHLREQLLQARSAVALAPLPGQVVGGELVDLGPQDAVVAVGFRRRPAGFGAALGAAAATGAYVVLLSDPTGHRHAAAASTWLRCPVASGLAFDSYAAPMAVAAVLADGVLGRAGAAGRERTGRISQSFEALREVERWI